MTDLAARIGPYVANLLAPGGRLEVALGDRLSMGQSRAMYRIHATGTAADGSAIDRNLVLRVEQHGMFDRSDDEVPIMRALHRLGHPVANIVAAETSHELLGQPFFLMEHMPGSSVQVPETVDAYVRELLKVHAVPASEFPFLKMPETPRHAALDQIERLYDIYHRSQLGEPSPLLEEGAEWLRIHAPEAARICLVHGDPGPGNYMHQDGRITAMVDWEFTHLGDPDEDYAYLVCMRGAGVMSEERWLECFASLGVQLEPERLRYWKAMNYFKGACYDQTAMPLYLLGVSNAPNLLPIGTGVHLSALRRLAETIG